MKLLSLLVAAFLGLSATAQAGVFIEPELGYGFSTFKDKTPVPPQSLKVNNYYYGARAGWQFHNWFFIGADYSATFGGKAKNDVGTKYNIDDKNLYGIIGGDWNVIRAYVGYGFQNDFTLDTGTKTKYNGGTHYKVGLAYKIFPMLALNVEYLASSYKKSIQTGGTSNPENIDDNQVRIGISIPWTFGDHGGSSGGSRGGRYR